MYRMRLVHLGAALIIVLVAVAIPATPASARDNATAIVAHTDGEGLNLRNAPSLSAAIINAMPEGAALQVVASGFFDENGTEWSQVIYDGVTGFSASQYLEVTTTENPGPILVTWTPPTSPSNDVKMATVLGTDGDGLNVRAAPSLDGEIVSGLLEGARVTIVDGPIRSDIGDPWYQIKTDAITGWVHGAYLVEDTPAPESAAEQTGDDASVGNALVAEAMQFLGYPYVWAGTTPDGFDCSGFTYYVVNQVLGNDFPRAIDEQIILGEYIAPEDLEPGDLVFLKDTYQPGLSHVGFYIGSGQFISAVNEEDGVALRDLWSDYWGQRYVTARRVR